MLGGIEGPLAYIAFFIDFTLYLPLCANGKKNHADYENYLMNTQIIDVRKSTTLLEQNFAQTKIETIGLKRSTCV